VTRLALLFPLWLTLAVGEPSLVHQCPMHGGTSATEASTSAHAVHGGHAHHTAPQQSGKQTRHSCSCISECANSLAVVVATPATVPLAHVVPTTHVEIATSLFQDRREAHTPLPFANGPPALG
jgi:hypothetical protein